ncbi:MAG: very short patch repair endonuclease [Bryobacterales bacterium]|nr:very short patch repair endonuclease [Bryobacterales bacterium]
MKETREQRSRIMRAVKGADTAPELAVRRQVHGMGYRFRLHRKDLPGKPDLAFPRLHKVVFVHGCFWHGHDCARGARIPVRNREYWTRKVARNMERDTRAQAALKSLGWKILVVWECEIKDSGRMRRVLRRFLGRTA